MKPTFGKLISIAIAAVIFSILVFVIQLYSEVLATVIAIWQVLIALISIVGTSYIINLLYGYYKRRIRLKAIWDIPWKKSTSLTPNEILGRRPFHEFYWSREEDESIRKAIRNGKNVLIIGRPLSGKTRALYEALMSLDEPCDVLIPRYVDINIESFSIPKRFTFWRKKVLLLDDLHRFVDLRNFEYLLRTFLRNNTIIVASCPSSIEYKQTENMLMEKGVEFSTIFRENIIELPSLSEDEGKKIAEQVGKRWSEIRFDKTIGSIFMPLKEMERRFSDDCTPEEKFLLRSTKLLYLCGLYEGKQNFPSGWIKCVCRRKYQLAKKEFEWLTLLEGLAKKELLEMKPDKIHVEEAYIEKCFEMETNISVQHILMEMQTVFSDDFYALVRLGETAHHSGYFEIADNAYEKAVKLRPTNIFLWINKGQNLGKQGHYGKALTCVNRALELDGANLFAWFNKGFYLFKLERQDEAVKHYDKSLELDRTYVPAWYNKGYALHKLGKDEDAVTCYDRALELDPGNKVTWDNKGYSLFSLRKYKEAIECYDRALKIDATFVKPLNNKGQALGKMGRFEEALVNLDKALNMALKCDLYQHDPEYVASIWDNKGYILNEQKRWNEALKCFEEALELNPKYTSAWNNRVYASFHKSLKETREGSIFTTSATIFRAALGEVDNKGKFLTSVNRGVVSFFKNAIFECNVNSKEELMFLVKEFEGAFIRLGLRTPPLDEIEDKCRQSKEYDLHRGKMEKIFS